MLVSVSIVCANGQTFEVASVKVNLSGARAVSIGSPSPGTFRAENVWLRFLIQNAWNVKDFQVSGGPGWANSDRFDIGAKASSPVRFEQMRPMLQALLEDRFRLMVHTESKDMPVYALTVAKGGIRLKASREAGNTESGGLTSSPRSLKGTGVSMAQLAAALSNIMQRPVVDQTGLPGIFDIRMEWTADQSTPGFWAPGLGPGPGGEPQDAGGASIFTVIQEQLGLKLESTHGPVMILVVDYAERPSAN